VSSDWSAFLGGFDEFMKARCGSGCCDRCGAARIRAWFNVADARGVDLTMMTDVRARLAK
jgi:hypothetical protein